MQGMREKLKEDKGVSRSYGRYRSLVSGALRNTDMLGFGLKFI